MSFFLRLYSVLKCQNLSACVHYLGIFDRYVWFPIYVSKSFIYFGASKYILKTKGGQSWRHKRVKVFVLFLLTEITG